eukprot:4876632-Prymnesium_polylepis.1
MPTPPPRPNARLSVVHSHGHARWTSRRPASAAKSEPGVVVSAVGEGGAVPGAPAFSIKPCSVALRASRRSFESVRCMEESGTRYQRTPHGEPLESSMITCRAPTRDA